MAKPRAKTHTPKTRAVGVAVPVNQSPERAAPQELQTEEAIAALAYQLWIERGCPLGTPEEDWFRAEEELKHRKPMAAKAAGAP
jgi:hypothetical protein